MNCLGTNSSGEPCAAPTVDATGYCPAHRAGGDEHMRELAVKGGKATAAKHESVAFTAEELTPLVTGDDAKLALDEIRVAVMTRRLTHAEGNAASKAVSEWVKAEQSMIAKRLTDEFEAVIAEKDAEIAALTKQLGGRTMRVAR